MPGFGRRARWTRLDRVHIPLFRARKRQLPFCLLQVRIAPATGVSVRLNECRGSCLVDAACILAGLRTHSFAITYPYRSRRVDILST